jgi:predicted PurR-regulated permease PerM
VDGQTSRYAYAIAAGGIAILLAWFLLMVIIQLREILAVLFLGMVVGLALSPLAEYLARFRVPRVASVLAVYGIVAIGLGFFFWYAGGVVMREALNVQIEELRELYEETRNGVPLPPWEDAETFVLERGEGVVGQVIDRPSSR